MQVHPDYKTKPVKGWERHVDEILERMLSNKKHTSKQIKLEPSKDYKRKN